MDTSFLVGNAPQPLLNPLDIQAKRIAIRNALAQGTLQDQAIQGGALSLQQQQAALAHGQAFNALMHPVAAAAPAPQPAVSPAFASPSPDSSALPTAPAFAPPAQPAAQAGGPPEITDAQIMDAYGSDPQAGLTIIHSRNLANKEGADYKDKIAETAQKRTNILGMVSAGVKAAGFTPEAVQHAAQMLHSYGMDTEAQQLSDVYQKNPNALPAVAEQFIGQSTDAQKTISENVTAAAHRQTANDGTRKTDAELPGLTADSTLKGLTASGKAPIQPVEQARLDGEAAGRAQTARHQRIEEAQSAARLRIEQSNAAYAQQGGGSLQDPAYMAGIVRGEIQINPRDKNFAQVSAQAKGLDPTWTSDRFSNRQHTTQSFVSGPVSKKLESFNQVTSHLGELKVASDALGYNPMQYTPNMVGNFSSAVKRYNDSMTTAGAELSTTLAQGQATQHEVDTATNNLKSWNPAARAAGQKQYTVLIGGRLRAMAKQYSAGTGDVFPVDQYVDSDAITQLQKNGVDPYKIAQDEAPSWMKAKGTTVAGVAPRGAAPAAAPAAAAPASAASGLQHLSTDELFKQLTGGK